jgi:uncharacterized protein
MKDSQYFSPGPPLMNEDVIFPDQSGTRLIKNDIIQLLKTNFGERVMNPNFGTNLKSSLFELIHQGLENSIKQSIIEAINLWEPRVELKNVTILESKDENTINIGIYAVIKGTKTDLKFNLEFNKAGGIR